MGVLEDAIRQHLELKRQHGAAEEELTRQEAEALGPARRAGAEPDAEGAESELVAEAESLPADAHDVRVAELDQHASEVDADAPTTVAHRDDLVPAEPGEHHGDPLLDDVHHAAEPAQPAQAIEPEPELPPAEVPSEAQPEPAAAAPEPAAPQEPPATQEPVSFDDEDDPIDWDGTATEDEDAEAAKPADPLEETPDFLEDTPEHDRLWFEQRPPRDFDFD